MSDSVFGPAWVRAIAPYVAGKPISEVAREFNLDETRIVKLASNENPLGVPASAQAAMAAEVAELGRYPDANGFRLKAALSAQYGVPQAWLTLGNGSNDILELAAHAIVQPGEAVIYAQHSFAVYALATQAVGGRAIEVPAQAFGHDLAGMAAAITPDTKLIYIANPNNPTGTFIEAADIAVFLAQVPSHVVVVLDEAYNEYLPAEKQYDAVQWVKQYPNLLISRTFSKAYGLAGLRIGFGIAQPVITDLLNRVRQPFNVNSLAQAAAIAALADQDFLQRSAALNAAGYAYFTRVFETLGLAYVPSFGNFVLVKVGDAPDAGAQINLALLKQGVIVRPVANYGLPQWLRISIGLPTENAAFVVALCHALGRPVTDAVKLAANFKDNLAQLPSIAHLQGIRLQTASGAAAGEIPNQPGKQGALAVYAWLVQCFGSQLHAEAARYALALFGEHTADAQAHPGKHPNIDRLFTIAKGGAPLTMMLDAA